jgi:ABC-type multidrug transport system ATPase subunit
VALDGVDLEIGTGLFGLLGPNGAGKSTLMRIMCTLLVPTAGSLRVGGHDVVAERRAVRAMVGYLPQEFGAWRLHRVEEVLDTLARLSGLRDKTARQARVRAVLEQVGLHEVADRKVKKLSGGMVRRLGVAQALIHEPQVIIVDEPTVGLDPEERLRFRQLMAGLGQDRTIVLSTHIVADLGSGCSDLALIDDGKIVFRGGPAELAKRAEGTVFEMASDAVPDEFEVVSRTREADGVKIRAVCKAGQIPEGARVAQNPTLEEAYLSFMVARDRAEVARADEEQP